ncbi:MAG: GNAT family N-acetyltransferase [Bacteroidales bacterium]|nr:GNAT family N-acetyltransferase [Bacteroidales bacterium]
MEDKIDITVREIQLKDIDLIADYWLESDSDFLVQMGVDLNKLPTRNGLREVLTEQINKSITDKKSYALIWELNGKQIGHSNINGIEYGKEATMHLHLWESTNRKKGIGTELVKKSLPYYFEQLEIKKLICEPYALNPSPNKTLEKVGFEFIKKYRTIPGSLNFEQDVNRWELTREKYNALQQLV